MCHRRPGPRCSNHTRKELVSATLSLKSAVRNRESETIITQKREKVHQARESWYHTPDGIESLKKKGKGDLADLYERERKRQIAAMHIDKHAHSRHEKNREQAASHPLADCATTLHTLSNDSSLHVRRAVAMHPSADKQLMMNMASDERPEVRSVLATRQNQDADILHKLAKDQNAYIRQCVASNPETTGATLKMLIHDSDSTVRATAVAAYDGLSHEEMESIVHGKRVEVRKSFAKNGKDAELLHELAQDKHTEVRENLAYNPHITNKTRDVLVNDRTPAVRIAVANARHCPEPTLDRLSYDEHNAVVFTVAQRSKNPETLKRLSNHLDSKVRHAAKMNKNTPQEEIEKVHTSEMPVIKGPAHSIDRLKKSHPNLAARLAS